MAGALFRDIHDPVIADLVGTGIVSEPVEAILSLPIEVNAEQRLETLLAGLDAMDHDLDLVCDPVHAMADDHIRLAKPNRTRSKR